MKVKTITEKEIALFEQKLVKAEKSASTIKNICVMSKNSRFFYQLRKNLFRRIRWMRSFVPFRRRDMAPAASIRSLPVLNPIAF